mmetsp:Transcript_21313/g.29318  ORF Transcript_21313/g.29318 Transcript_21313/m.29318 type:complete len:210 (+) Transcript_21313:1-630(+)
MPSLTLIIILVKVVSIFGLRQHSRISSALYMGGGIVRGDSLPQLIKLIENSNKGVITNDRAQVVELIEMIGDKNSAFITNDATISTRVSGNWELLWTTEKETLFFIKNGLFGRKVTSVMQSIDFKDNKIQNIIKFQNDGDFSVTGAISTSSTMRNRINFNFTDASILFPPFSRIFFPPVGKGWFDNIFVNDKYRLSKDIRGDYLISKKI